MKKAVLKLIVVASIAASSGAWAETDTGFRCGLSLGGAPDAEERKGESKTALNHYERSLAGPRVEKAQQLTAAENFKVPATQRLLPELLTLANIGCIWRF